MLSYNRTCFLSVPMNMHRSRSATILMWGHDIAKRLVTVPWSVQTRQWETGIVIQVQPHSIPGSNQVWFGFSYPGFDLRKNFLGLSRIKGWGLTLAEVIFLSENHPATYLQSTLFLPYLIYQPKSFSWIHYRPSRRRPYGWQHDRNHTSFWLHGPIQAPQSPRILAVVDLTNALRQ